MLFADTVVCPSTVDDWETRQRILTENFTAQQKSGRPAQPRRSRQQQQQHRKNSSTTPGIIPPLTLDISRRVDSPVDISHISPIPSWLQLFPNGPETDSTNASSTELEEYLSSLTGPPIETNIEFASDIDFQQSQASPMAAPGHTMGCIEGHSTVVAESYIRDTAELGSRICRLYGTGQKLPSSEDLINATRSLLRMINSFAMHTELTREAAEDWHGLGIPPQSWYSQGECPGRPPSLDTTTETAIDTSTALLLLSTHQRLLALFEHIIRSLHHQIAVRLARDPTRQWSDSSQYLEGGAQHESHTVTNAQVVMTMELLIHLLNKLDKGQVQLTSAFGNQLIPTSTAASSSPPSPEPAACVPPSHVQPSMDVSSDDESSSCLSTNSITEGYYSCLVGITRSVAGMIRYRQSSLNLRIRSLKRLVDSLDDI